MYNEDLRVGKSIRLILRDEFDAAREELEVVTEKFDSLTRRGPRGQSDREYERRLFSASAQLSKVRQAHVQAFSRLNDFVLHGIVPPELEVRDPRAGLEQEMVCTR